MPTSAAPSLCSVLSAAPTARRSGRIVGGASGRWDSLLEVLQGTAEMGQPVPRSLDRCKRAVPGPATLASAHGSCHNRGVMGSPLVLVLVLSRQLHAVRPAPRC